MAIWQRWMIDELDADLARVLVAHAQQPFESTAAEALGIGSGARLRGAVSALEAVAPDDLWGEERPVYLRPARLRVLVERRRDIPGLPEPRDLREGDVFWIVLPADLSPELLASATPRRLVSRPDRFEPQVWDVTAAARQTVRREYHDLLRAASDDPE
jgi:hypothetical protein